MPLSAETLSDWLRLQALPGFGASWMQHYLRQHPDPGQLLALPAHSARRAGAPAEWTRARAENARSAALEARLARQRDYCLQHGICCLAFDDPDYPPLLAEIADPPLLLYVEGDVDLLRAPQLAVVGSRKARRESAKQAYRFARELAAAGLVITSGLAAGIDAAAHSGALAAGRTIAVMGTGIDRSYPRASADLRPQIAASGAVVTELPPGLGPLRHHFPRRNRIISGLSLGVLVVEAAEKSGSLITARLALEQNREVFAVPGAAGNPNARGSNRLIGDGARLVLEPVDIVDVLCAWTHGGAPLEAENTAPIPTGTPGRVLQAIGQEPVSLDELVAELNLPAPELTVYLTRLELEGRLESLGGFWVRA